MNTIQIKLNSIKENVFKNNSLTDDIMEVIDLKPSLFLYTKVRDRVIKKILDLKKENLLNRSFSFFCLVHFLQTDYDTAIINDYCLCDLIPTYDNISEEYNYIVVFSAMLDFLIQDVYIVSDTKEFFTKLTDDHIQDWKRIALSEHKELKIVE